MHFIWEDATSISLQIRHEEKILYGKRRYLMGLLKSPSPICSSKQLESCDFLADASLPEPILRDDDVFMENVRTTIQRSFEAFSGSQEVHHVVQDYQQFFDTNIADSGSFRKSVHFMLLSSILDDLNNIALCHLANIVTGNSVKFVKTRPKMKNLIKKFLPMIFRKTNPYTDCVKSLPEIAAVMRDSKNFRGSCMKFLTHFSPSHLSYAKWVLKNLHSFDFQALYAMNRKLKGLKRVPKLQPNRRLNTNKSDLIESLRNKYKKLLSKRSEGDEVPRPLAEALMVASLSVKQMVGRDDGHVPQFSLVQPKVEALQNDILKATWAIQEFPFGKLKGLLFILDPNAKISRRLRRKYIKRFLIEYLFECGELGIPDSVLRAVTFINKNSQFVSTKEKMEEELECVLNVSSQLKQIVWDLSLHPNVDQDFADAYMADSESDDEEENGSDNCCSDHENSNSFNLSYRDDTCFGDSDQKQTHGPFPVIKQEIISDSTVAGGPFIGNITKQPKSENTVEPCSSHQHGFGSPSPMEEVIKAPAQNSPDEKENEYLIIQDICDETSLFAHRFIGRLLEELLQIKGNNLETATRSYLRGGMSVPTDFQVGLQSSSTEDTGAHALIRVLGELIPTFPTSVTERLKELLGLL